MANTHSNLTGDIRRIHETFPVSDIAEGVWTVLSSKEGHISQIDIVPVKVRRHFGRRALTLNLIDRSGLAEFDGTASAVRIRLPLGHTAVVGRDSHSLPLLQSELTFSENHLNLTYTRQNGTDTLEIHDYESFNGSHIVDETESTWQERLEEVSSEAEAANGHTDADVTDEQFDAQREWLFGPDWDSTQSLRPVS